MGALAHLSCSGGECSLNGRAILMSCSICVSTSVLTSWGEIDREEKETQTKQKKIIVHKQTSEELGIIKGSLADGKSTAPVQVRLWLCRD